LEEDERDEDEKEALVCCLQTSRKSSTSDRSNELENRAAFSTSAFNQRREAVIIREKRRGYKREEKRL